MIILFKDLFTKYCISSLEYNRNFSNDFKNFRTSELSYEIHMIVERRY